MGKFIGLVNRWFVRGFSLVSFCLLSTKSRVKNFLDFAEAKFSEDGVTIVDIATARAFLLDNGATSKLRCRINKAFFAFDGSDCLLSKIYLTSGYSLIWHLWIESLNIYEKNLEVHNLLLKNSQMGYLKARKISNLGKVSAFNVETGYDEPMGWNFYSSMVTYEDFKVYCIGNKLGVGKARCFCPNLVFSTKASNGFLVPSLKKDFGDYYYLNMSYYFISKDESCDLILSPMIYSKDLGVQAKFRDLVNGLSLDLHLERAASYLSGFKDKGLDIPRNCIAGVKVKNDNLDVDLTFFNMSLFNKSVWKNMLFNSLSDISKDYRGYAYLEGLPFKASYLQRNDTYVLKCEVPLSDSIKVVAERDFSETLSCEAVASQKIHEDFDLFLVDLKGDLKYLFFDKNGPTDISMSNLKVKSLLRVDLPFVGVSKYIISGSVSFDFSAGIIELLEAIQGIRKLGASEIISHKLFPNTTLDLDISSGDSTGRFFVVDKLNFGLEIPLFDKVVDSVFLEKKDGKFFLGCIYFDGGRCYGIKINEDRLLLEFFFNIDDSIKFKCISSYSFKNGLICSESLSDEDTYIHCSITFIACSWKVNVGFGMKNIPDSLRRFTYNLSITPREWIPIEEVGFFIRDVEVEKKKVLNLYDKFK